MKLKYFLVILLCANAYADLPDYSQNLTGDWSGQRRNLAKAGTDISLNYQADLMSNLMGGIKRTAGILNSLNLGLDFDGAKLFDLKGSKAYVNILAQQGAKPNQHWVGSSLQVNNYEFSSATVKFEQAWLSQDFMDEKINLLAGLYDLNHDFNITNSSSIFIAPGYGIDDEISQTATYLSKTYGGSTFPNTSLGSRLKFKPNELVYFQTAVVDALLYKNTNMNHSNSFIGKRDGAMYIAEAGITSNYGNYGAGIWQFSKKFVDLLDNKTLKSNQGYYFMGEKSLYQQSSQELFFFTRYGTANKQVMQIDYTLSAGFTLNGAIRGRDDSQLGFAISKAHLSKNYVQAIINNNQKTRSCETSLELTYIDKLKPWLKIQPDLQYIITPALNPVNQNDSFLKNALLAMIRININF